MDTRKYETTAPADVSGFLRYVRDILRMPRVQRIEITPGKIRWEREVVPGEPAEASPLEGEEFDPATLLKACALTDLPWTEKPEVAFYRVLSAFDQNGLVPGGVVVPAGPGVWSWLRHPEPPPAASVRYLLGLPVVFAPTLPDEAVFVFAASVPGLPLERASHAVRIPYPAHAITRVPVPVTQGEDA